MLEILFTAKAHAGYWVKGAYACKDNKSYIIASERVDAFDEVFEAYEVIPETVSMFTKRFDKNNQPIFAGHILRRHKGELLIICWSEADAMFNALLYSERHKNVIGAAFLRDMQLYKYEIVGNIHDNPEMVRGWGK